MTSSDAETDFKPIMLQGALVRSLSESVLGKNIELWVTTLNNLPAHLFNFAKLFSKYYRPQLI